MACGEWGPGRLAEPPVILDRIADLLHPAETRTLRRPLNGHHIIVTSGPTHEPIDPVRYIANRSSGKQGHAIAAALVELGARVTLVSGPVAIPDPPSARVLHVETAIEMLDACRAALPADAAICVAAVADWRVAAPSDIKLKKARGAEAPALVLTQNPDILADLAAPAPNRPRFVIGFAAETNDLLAHAAEKRARKGCDWLLANDVSAAGGAMGGDDNEIHLITAEGTESWPRMSKPDVARRLAQRLAEALGDA